MKTVPFLALLTLFSVSCLGPVPELYPESESERNRIVYLVSYSWHVGLVVDAAELTLQLPVEEWYPEIDYFEVGWGDNRYYPNPSPGFGTLLRAALLPTGSVIHLTGFNGPVERRFPTADIIRIRLSDSGMESLIDHLTSQFRRHDDGSLYYLTDGLYRDSHFFESHGLYHLPKTSNRWVASALRKAGTPVSPFYALTSGNLIRQAGSFGDVIQERSR